MASSWYIRSGLRCKRNGHANARRRIRYRDATAWRDRRRRDVAWHASSNQPAVTDDDAATYDAAHDVAADDVAAHDGGSNDAVEPCGVTATIDATLAATTTT